MSPIFVVDDDPNDIFLFRRAAAKAELGNPIESAEDGVQAIELLDRFGSGDPTSQAVPPLFLLLDLKMPRKTGFEVLEWVRAQPRLHRLPVIIFTSSNQSADIDRAYDLGANSYLVKPGAFADLVRLVELVGRYWTGYNQAPELPASVAELQP